MRTALSQAQRRLAPLAAFFMLFLTALAGGEGIVPASSGPSEAQRPAAQSALALPAEQAASRVAGEDRHSPPDPFLPVDPTGSVRAPSAEPSALASAASDAPPRRPATGFLARAPPFA